LAFADIAITVLDRLRRAGLIRSSDRLTLEHVHHVRDVYGYSVPEIASHYGRGARYIGVLARS
jgi:hypothetical protein